MGVVIPQVVTEDRASGAQIVDGGLRFDSGKTHYLSRTPGSAGNRRTWTWSSWVKRNKLVSYQTIFGAVSTNGESTNFTFSFGSNDIIAIEYGIDTWRYTSAVFRDTSAWMHICLAADTTQATPSDRLRLYINGSEVKEFSINNAVTENVELAINSTTTHLIGNLAPSTPYWLPAQVSQVYLIDGQALGPEYFGYTDPLTNTWRPKKYKTSIDTYVNNGTVWSNSWGASGSTGNVDNGANAFDGSLSTYASNQNSNTTVIWQPSSPIPVRRTLRVYAAAISSGAGQVAVNGTSLGTIPGSTPQWFTIQGATQLTSISLTDIGPTHGRLYAVEVDGVILVNSSTSNSLVDNYFFGTNGFHLPFDGSAPIGQDQSGRGNNWTPVNFGGSNTIEKATGALPILNTDGGGKVARVGVRTDANASSLVLALPLVGIKSDFSNAINSGTTEKAVTATNAVASNAQSNFYGGSFDFDGTASAKSLSFSPGSDLAFGTGDFTIEAWVNMTSRTTGSNQFVFDTTGGTRLAFYQGASNGYEQVAFYIGGTTGIITPVAVVQYGTWQHWAVSRQSGTLRLFVDGVLHNIAANSDDITAQTTAYIGNYASAPSGSYNANGYIQDFRIYKGVAKYTSNFIPASTDPDIVPDSPSGVSYSSNVALVPSTDGGSLSNTSSSRLEIGSSADFDLTGVNWTIETFFNCTSTSSARMWYFGNNAQNIQWSGTSELLYYNGSNAYTFGSLALNTWYHLALVNQSGTVTAYINGIAQTTFPAGSSTTRTLTIGDFAGGTTDNNWIGFISNFHIVKGTALYTSNFTPPTAPLTDVTNTKLLCCQSNTSAGAAAVAPGSITANGNAAATNFNPFTTDINAVRGQESGYATLNPLEKTSSLSLLNGNLQTSLSTAAHNGVRGTIGVSSGKWYWEYTQTANVDNGNITYLGISQQSDLLTELYGPGATIYMYQANDGSSRHNGTSNLSYGDSWTSGDIIGVAVDLTSATTTITFYKNGVSQGIAYSNLAAGTYFPSCGLFQNQSGAINFGQKPFKFPPPPGFQPLTLANTPRPTIVRPDQYVGISTWVGNYPASTSVNLGWKPDFVWLKSRSNATAHLLFDTVRGATYYLSSNATDAESNSPSTTLTSFDSSGFTVGNNSTANGGNMVAWAWKAGGNSNTFNIDDVGYDTASAAGLTAGSITPTGASVNTKSGFSIITWTSPDPAGGITPIPHGLGKTPQFMIFKNRDLNNHWTIYHSSFSNLTRNYLKFSAESVFTRGADLWGTIDSSVFSIDEGFLANPSERNVAYLWAEIPGFSKFGSFTSSNPGAFINLGFRPKLFMAKQITGAGGNWFVADVERSKFNPTQILLDWNLVDQERSATIWDLNSNGAKDVYNGFSGTFIYAAWAETPTFNLYGAQANAR
jgi:hypothetical protein